ncbi:AraC family transcriptional regulator, partial [Streptococcus thermophilus]|nr:AraC family transcriptional regulator [Streptococcus thermophilus]
CTQYINGEKVTLHQHNLILMDKDIVQQIESTGSNDILINILLKNDSTMNQLFDYIAVSTNEITQFLYNASHI